MFLREKQWWTNVFANFIGVIFGIILTFGTSGYLARCDKRNMERKVALMTISNIEQSILDIEDVANDICRIDTIIQTVKNHYPDRLDQVSEDTLYMYINSFDYYHSFVLDQSAEGIFTHSSDIWRTLDNPALSQRIGYCFALRDALQGLIDYLYRTQSAAASGFFEEKFLFDRGSLVEAVKELTDVPQVRHFIQKHHMSMSLFNEELALLKAMNEYNKQDMNISEEEFAKYLEYANEDYLDEIPDSCENQ